MMMRMVQAAVPAGTHSCGLKISDGHGVGRRRRSASLGLEHRHDGRLSRSIRRVDHGLNDSSSSVDEP